jgi:hypothetical protein
VRSDDVARLQDAMLETARAALALVRTCADPEVAIVVLAVAEVLGDLADVVDRIVTDTYAEEQEPPLLALRKGAR